MDTATPIAGDRYLGPTGLIWTVVRTTRRGDRVHIVTDDDHGAVIDLVALARMIRLDAPGIELTVVAGDRPATAADVAAATAPGDPAAAA